MRIGCELRLQGSGRQAVHYWSRPERVQDWPQPVNPAMHAAAWLLQTEASKVATVDGYCMSGRCLAHAPRNVSIDHGPACPTMRAVSCSCLGSLCVRSLLHKRALNKSEQRLPTITTLDPALILVGAA